MKKIFQANGIQKKAGVAILISDKIHFKLKMVKINIRRSLSRASLVAQWLRICLLMQGTGV